MTAKCDHCDQSNWKIFKDIWLWIYVLIMNRYVNEDGKF